MRKTTIYLPDDLKAALERAAATEHRSEAEIIREALRESLVDRVTPSPRIPLSHGSLGDPTIAERVDDLLEGFGRS
ncbi:MAG: CopG family transcriptional regulator [Actinomycetota bacterium]